MTEQLQLIARQLHHLGRMGRYLRYSYERVQPIAAALDWSLPSPEQHESLAAFRVRFSEFQEHLGKAMRAVAVEEEVEVDRFGTVLAFMEKLASIDSAEHWKLLRELRNAVNVVSRAALVISGIRADGYREILGVRIGNSESFTTWDETFRWLKSRGLRGVLFVIADSHSGLTQAIGKNFQGATWQRCQVHMMRNFLRTALPNARPRSPPPRS